jgi:hypothetical protein
MREPVTTIGEPTAHESARSARFHAIGKWLEKTKYDPEIGSRAEDFQTPVSDYARRFLVGESNKFTVSVPGVGGEFRPYEIEGTILEPIHESKRWKPVSIRNRTDLKSFYESDAGKRKRFMEQFGGGFDDDMGSVRSSLNATTLIDQDEFVPFMNGPFYKQLYVYDYLLMHARAFQLANHNALAAAAVKILSRFVLGRGVSFHVKDDACREIWEEFWDRNNMRLRMRQMARDLTWQGELLLKFVESQKGFLTMRVLDASTCWEVVTDPEDIDHVFYYHFQYPTPYQIYVTNKIPVTKYVIQQIPPTNIQHLKINCSSQEKRGRSDLLPCMAWLKRFDDFYNGITLKQVLEANLVWKIKIKGDQADIDQFMQNPQFTTLPPPGGTWLENESVELEPITGQMTASRGASGVGAELASIVAASLNLPAEYFNIVGQAGGSARATALVRTDPAVKAIEDRQQLMRETLEEIYDRVMANAIDSGRLDKARARHEPVSSIAIDPEDGESLRDKPVQSQPIHLGRPSIPVQPSHAVMTRVPRMPVH